MAALGFRSLPALALCAALAACGDDDTDAPLQDSGTQHEHDAAVPDASEPEPDAAIVDDDAGQEDASREPEPLEDSAYYPVTDGARWVYRHAGGDTEWDEEVVLTHTHYDGKPAFMLRDTPGPSGKRSETILTRVGASQVSRVYREEFRGDALQATASYAPGFVRFDHSWPARAVGYTETLSYEREERDETGALTADGARSHRYTIEAHDETVDVPAGTFDDCLRVRRSRVRAIGAEPVEGDEDLFWFCPDVGKVREQDTVSLETEELVSYEVP